MKCEWCKFDFCWSCMNEERKCLAKICYIPLCPRLPFNLCINFMITLLAILLAPLFLILSPFLAAMYLALYEIPRKIITRIYGGRYICKRRRINGDGRWKIPLIILVSVVSILPLSLVLAALLACLLGSIGLLLFWSLCLIYIVITTKNWIRLLCK